MWCVADLDADYIAKMEDVLALYERPYDADQQVVCLDEKPVALRADLSPGSPAVPGRETRRDNEYQRCGTANVSCAVEPKAGRHFIYATPNRSRFEFAQVICRLALAYARAATIHLVLDNLNLHCRKSLIDQYGAELGNQCGTALRYTTLPSTTAGSIRQKLKSGRSHADAGGAKEFPI